MGKHSEHVAVCRHFWPLGSQQKRGQEAGRVEPDDHHVHGAEISVLLNAELVTQIDIKKWTSVKKNPDGSEFPVGIPNRWPNCRPRVTSAFKVSTAAFRSSSATLRSRLSLPNSPPSIATGAFFR